MRTAALALALALALATALGPKSKRQIFREHVLPHSGGKIPEEAFRPDRLALNLLNQAGVAVPDGVLLEPRPQHRPLERPADVVRVALTPDPGGGGAGVVDSTYVIRQPVGVVDAYRPVVATPMAGDKTPPNVYTLLGQLKQRAEVHTAAALASGSLTSRPWPSRLPGVAGRDFPDLQEIPQTHFRCPSSNTDGYTLEADADTGCQVFHVCQRGQRRESFLCPSGTVFVQAQRHCDWWFRTCCSCT